MTETELREINEKVAQRLGWTRNDDRYRGIQYRQGNMYTPDLPNYAGSIADAWEVVEHLTKDSPYRKYEVGLAHRGFQAHVWITNDPLMPNNRIVADAIAETAPLAICRAFLALEESK